MIGFPEDGLLYHGSYVEIRAIDFSLAERFLDFGQGFYVTSSLSQAASYVPSAVRKAKRKGLLPDAFQDKDGIVTCFQYKQNPLLFVHFFQAADKEWLHFVACNRNRRLFPELRKKYETVDIIGGKVADDQTALTLNSYVSGAYGIPGTERADRTAIELLEPERLTDQFCFRTQEAISSLQYVRSEKYGYLRNHLR